MLREKLLEYFSFTRKERVGFLVLIFLIIMIFVIPYFFDFRKDNNDGRLSDELRNQIAQLKKMEKNDSVKNKDLENGGDDEDDSKKQTSSYRHIDYKKISPFFFDPNTISASQWKQLGLRDKTISTIQHYLEKGGRFKIATDLKKVYGIRDEDYERLSPFIKIVTGLKSSHADTSTSIKKNLADVGTKKKTTAIVEINSADSITLASLPGIGNKIASRIIHFRERLGGFYSVEQIGEVYGLSEELYQLIKSSLKINTDALHKIDINNADLNTLKQHPYIRWELAKAIIQYRSQHGPFKNSEDLQKVDLLTNEVYMKINPYIKIN